MGSRGRAWRVSVKEVEFVIPLGPDDRYRHYHLRSGKEVLEFSIQYETFCKEKWSPVVRYDTAHGYTHRDIVNPSGEISKTPLFTLDYNDALTFAESDIKINREIYKKRFLGSFQ